MALPPRSRSRATGFTLIEMMVTISVAVILRSGGTSLEPGRGLFSRQRSIGAAAAAEPTA